MEYSFQRYLLAKRSVDDRSLNGRIWEQFSQILQSAQQIQRASLIEIGAGIGTMFQRLTSSGLLRNAEYTALDSQSENVHFALETLPGWAGNQGGMVKPHPAGFALHTSHAKIDLIFEETDIFQFIPTVRGRKTWDFLLAHAFLDLVNVLTTLPQLCSIVRPGGLMYFTINFDGLTIFEPAFDPALDEAIQAAYHRTMDERLREGKCSGNSRSGRRMFHWLQTAGCETIEAGSSDWVVFPRNGKYPEDEGYFLHFIIHTVAEALKNNSEIDPERLAAWESFRHRQIEQAELVYIAHQMDFLVRTPLV